MKTDKITVFDLFEKQRRYLVPIFQRGYVWTRAGQWEPLWEDLLEQATIVHRNSGASRQAVRKHFLGAIVLNQAPTVIRQVAASEIIDGQQRLLTLQVLLAALRDVTQGMGNAYLKSNLERLTNNPGPFRDPDEKFKVRPTNAYHDDLRNVMNAGSATELAKKYPQHSYYRKLIPPRPPLVDAYLYFYEVMSRYLRQTTESDSDNGAGPTPDAPLNEERAEELEQAITRYVQLVVIELDAEDDPQVIFETLNARGVPLEPSDLVRNFVFLYALRHGENVEDLYQRRWKEFDETPGTVGGFWKEKERQGRLMRSRFDLFLFHYLIYRTEKDIKVGHIYQEFKDWWENVEQNRNVENELKALGQTSKIYKDLLAPKKDSYFGTFAERVRILDVTTVYPLMLWIAEWQEKLTAEEFDGILVDIESYLVRRAVCGLTPKNYNRTFLTLLSKLRKDSPPNRASLRRELVTLRGDSVEWPNDTSLRSRLLVAPLYENLGPRRTRMLLMALERSLWTANREVEFVGDNLTVEHVMPQSAQVADWPYPNTPDLSTDAAFRGTIVHSLGNLTLLTQPLNSTVSRGPFRLKRPEITKQSGLALNAYFQKFGDADAWHEGTVIVRGGHLADLAIRVWPYPDAST